MTTNKFLMDAGRDELHNEWKGTFEAYFNLAIKQPEVTQLATQRLYKMILSYGHTRQPDGRMEYNFFKNRIFGAEEQIEDIMMYLKAASMGLDIKKRVLLLLGPPGGGKSQILTMMKKGLAAYSRTSKGAIYAIKDCPLNEEPMHLIPENKRKEIKEKYDIHIEGKLCPACQFNFENDWNRNINNVPVERVYINEDNRVGIGTFAPAEKNDMSELYGSADLSKVDYFGNEGDVRAYAFNGELHTANRGVMEFIEVLKAKPDFLHVLLTLAEEQQFKTPRFPLQYVDETLIAHTNEGEFLRFIEQKENEAVVDRLYIVKMPYNMKVLNEEKIYHAAIKSKLNVKGVTLHPGAIRLASEFAIRTRNHENPLRVGMSGLSPRFVLNTVAIALVKVGKELIEPIDMLTILNHQIMNYPVLTQEKREEYLEYLKGLGQEIPKFNSVRSIVVSTEEKNNAKSSMFDLILGED